MNNKCVLLFDAKYRSRFAISSEILSYLRSAFLDMIPNMTGVMYSNNLMSLLFLDIMNTTKSRYQNTLYKNDINILVRLVRRLIYCKIKVENLSACDIELFMEELDDWLADDEQICIFCTAMK